jgi:NAD(P)-dependent dehydrogenase (short-subunit alcohol dehydrogenase family)
VTGLCEGRVAVVTGGGRGLGREHALELARQGASVVVNDLGGAPDGSGSDLSAAQSVVEEIKALGGRAVVSGHDVSDWTAASELITLAIDTFGTLDVLVNNAGILRDRTLWSMTEQEWDDVIRVHLRGTFAPSHFAAKYWKAKAKESGPVDGRIINTSSPSGLYGNFGQTNYGAAKGGIASFTIIAALELAKAGVTVNAVAPTALTRLTDPVIPEAMRESLKEKLSPAQVAPLVAWLASAASADVTGRVFDVGGGRIAVCESWRIGAELRPEAPLSAEEVGKVLSDLLAQAAPNPDATGHVPAKTN